MQALRRPFRSVYWTALVLAAATPLVASAERFGEDPDGLGWKDSVTGLVWGHHLYLVDNYFTGATLTYSWDAAMAMTVTAPIDTDGDGLADAIGPTTYAEFSALWYGDPPAGYAWRLPTREELEEAVQAGLMSVLDLSPEPNPQTMYDDAANGSYPVGQDAWTSTTGGKKRGGFDSAYVVDLLGDPSRSRALTVGSALGGAIPVLAPVDSGDGDGGGKGKGGKK